MIILNSDSSTRSCRCVRTRCLLIQSSLREVKSHDEELLLEFLGNCIRKQYVQSMSEVLRCGVKTALVEIYVRLNFR